MRTKRIRDILAQAAFPAAMLSIVTAGLLALGAVVARGAEPQPKAKQVDAAEALESLAGVIDHSKTKPNTPVAAPGVYELPAGVIEVSETWKWRPNASRITLAGQGPGRTILRGADGLVAVLSLSAPDTAKIVEVEIRDLTIQGSGGPARASEGIRTFDGLYRTTFRRVHFEGVKFAIRTHQPKRTRAMRVLECSFDGPEIDQGILGVLPDLEVRGCTFTRLGTNDGHHAIYMNTWGDAGLGPVTIAGCLFDGPFCTIQTGPAFPSPAVPGQVVDLAIRDNTFRRDPGAGPASYCGAKGLVVTGNTFTNHSLFPPSAIDAIIAENRWQLSSDQADCLGFLGDFRNVTVRGNHFHGGRFALYLGGTGRGLAFSDNLCHGQSRATWCRTKDGKDPAENVTITNNSFHLTSGLPSVNFYDGYRPAGHQVIRGNFFSGVAGVAVYCTVPYAWTVEGNTLAPGQTTIVKRPEAKP